MTERESQDLTIRESRNGKGVFSKRNFSVGEIVFQVRGFFITCNEDDDIDEETRANAFRYNDDLYISPKGRVGDFLNHSCNPNSKVVKQGKKLFIISIKSIPAGREILIDYSTVLASDDVWTMRCNCGSKKCRLKTSKFKSLPKALKEKYISRGMVPDHILAN